MSLPDHGVTVGEPLVRLRSVAVALAIVYLVWGSTYVAIRIIVAQAPPLTAMGLRYLASGLIVGVIVAIRGGVQRLKLSGRQALGVALLGLMLPMMGNGVVTVGQSMGAPSGVTALLMAVVPLMIVILRSIDGNRPGRRTVLGVLLGLLGLAYLIVSGGFSRAGAVVPIGAVLIILIGAACWATGSYLQPRLWLPGDVFVVAAYQMVFGGLFLLGAGWGRQEKFTFDYSPRVWVSMAYLVIFGSVIAFTAYIWLVANAPISVVATHAYVNPVVGVFLGWLILAEPISVPILLSGAVVVASVVIVVSAERQKDRRSRPAAAGEEPV